MGNNDDFIVSHLTGYSLVTNASNAGVAWARYISDDCFNAGNDKEELRQWLLDNGYKKLKATNQSNVYQIIK